MVTTSKNSRPGLPLRPRASNSASALACNLRLASSEARVGFLDGAGYRGPGSRGALGVRWAPAVDEFENVGVGLTIPIWCNRSANPAGLASGSMESDIMSDEVAGVSLPSRGFSREWQIEHCRQVGGPRYHLSWMWKPLVSQIVSDPAAERAAAELVATSVRRPGRGWETFSTTSPRLSRRTIP